MTDSNRADLPPGLLAGRLEGIGLPSLVWELCRRGTSGVLKVSRPPIDRTLYVKEGRIVFVSSSDPNDRLGEMLLRHGKINLDELELALRNLRSGKRLGTLLVEAGSLTSDELVEAVLGQVKSIVLDMLNWERGEYAFTEGELPTHEVITLQMGTANLLLEAIRNSRSFSRIRHSVGPSRTVYALSSSCRDVLDGMSVSESEKLLIGRLESGEATVEELCREVLLSHYEIYQCLWAFRVLGLVEERDRPQLAQGPGSSEGRLGQDSFAELLVRFSREGQTGVLYMGRGDVDRSFHLREGRCLFATSSDPDDGLVSYLFRRGVISMQDREETARRLLSNKRVGTILREIGVIDDADLGDMVRQQLAEIVYDTFRWEDGDYAFVPGPLPSIEAITLDFDVSFLVAEGIRRTTSWTRVIRGCGGVDNPLRLTEHYRGLLDAMDAGVEEWDVVDALKTPQSPRRVCRRSELHDFRVCQILWTLSLLGGVEPSPAEIEPEPGLDEPAIEPPSPDATQLIARAEVEAALRELPERIHQMDSELIAATETAWGSADAAGGTPPEAGVDSDRALEASSERPAAKTPAAPSAPSPQFESGSAVEMAPLSAEPETETSGDAPAAGGEAPVPTLSDPTSDVETAGTEDAVDQPEEPREPDWEPPADLDLVISRFNAMHRLLYRAVRSEIGAGAVNFVRSCCADASAGSTDPVEGVDLQSDGSWDAKALRKVVLDSRIEDPWPIYQKVLDREYLLLKPHLGDAKAVELKQRIWELQQAELSSR